MPSPTRTKTAKFDVTKYQGLDRNPLIRLYRLTTYERDAESANDYAVHRYNANRLGRFLSTDPVLHVGGNPQMFNRYTYVHGDPINRRDYRGLDDAMFVDSGGAGAGGIDGWGGEADIFGDWNSGGWPSGDGSGGGSFGCTIEGIVAPCGEARALLSSGAGAQCPNNYCPGFKAFADRSSGYMPSGAPPGYSIADIANAASLVAQYANGTPIDPSQLTGRAHDVYELLKSLGVSPENILIYQNGTQSFAAVLTDKGFEQLENSSEFTSHFGDVALHYPYTDGGRDDNRTNSLHFVWFDETLSD